MWGAKPPTVLKVFSGPRGRPDLKKTPKKIRPDCLQVPSYGFTKISYAFGYPRGAQMVHNGPRRAVCKDPRDLYIGPSPHEVGRKANHSVRKWYYMDMCWVPEGSLAGFAGVRF